MGHHPQPHADAAVFRLCHHGYDDRRTARHGLLPAADAAEHLQRVRRANLLDLRGVPAAAGTVAALLQLPDLLVHRRAAGSDLLHDPVQENHGKSPAHAGRIKNSEIFVPSDNEQKEIADYLGYSGIQHYSKQFRDWFGCSPTSFAKYISR